MRGGGHEWMDGDDYDGSSGKEMYAKYISIFYMMEA